MKTNKFFIFTLLFPVFVFSQNKDGSGLFISALGVGYEQRYNEMILPYEFSGAAYNLNLEWQMRHSEKWFSDAKFNLHFAPLFAKTSAANVPAFNVSEHCFGFDLEYQLLRKIIDKQNFTLFAGGSLELMPEYEIFLDLSTNLAGSLTKQFFAMDLSLGGAVFAEYKFNKIRITDNFSFPLVAGAFYPHYQVPPFYYSGNYFVFASIGKLNRISNYLNFEIPVFVNDKILNTFCVGYNFNYEYSTIRDNFIRRIGHNFLVGVRFGITK
ncbi:hypothetical protein FACS189429_5220 [Bacteroidia bacterium]|nr:hypothetical protein FACS189429_5220 [Bacteroidia bacterium]